MTVMVREVYDALRSAGADEDKARRAAGAMARDDRSGVLEKKIDRLEQLIERLSAKVDERFAKMDERFAAMDGRLARVEARTEYQGKLLGILIGGLTAVLSGTVLLLVRVFLGGVT